MKFRFMKFHSPISVQRYLWGRALFPASGLWVVGERLSTPQTKVRYGEFTLVPQNKIFICGKDVLPRNPMWQMWGFVAGALCPAPRAFRLRGVYSSPQAINLSCGEKYFTRNWKRLTCKEYFLTRKSHFDLRGVICFPELKFWYAGMSCG